MTMNGKVTLISCATSQQLKHHIYGTLAIFAQCRSTISLRMNMSVLIAAVTETLHIGVFLTADVTAGCHRTQRSG